MVTDLASRQLSPSSSYSGLRAMDLSRPAISCSDTLPAFQPSTPLWGMSVAVLLLLTSCSLRRRAMLDMKPTRRGNTMRSTDIHMSLGPPTLLLCLTRPELYQTHPIRLGHMASGPKSGELNCGGRLGVQRPAAKAEKDKHRLRSDVHVA